MGHPFLFKVGYSSPSGEVDEDYPATRQRSPSLFPHCSSLKGENITQNRDSILHLVTRKACFITALFLLSVGQV